MLTLTWRPSNDLTRLSNALSTTALHPRPLPIVLNSSKQSGIVGDTSTKFTDLSGPSKTHPRYFPTSVRLHKTSPDHPGRERSAVKSAKCDRGFTLVHLNRSVPLHNPDCRQLACIRFCDGTVSGLWKTTEIPVRWAHNPLRQRKSQPVFKPTNNKRVMPANWRPCVRQTPLTVLLQSG